MRELLAEYVARFPRLRFGLLGTRHHRHQLDLEPLGFPAAFHAAEDNADLARQYKIANGLRFQGELSLPGWVFSDLYLLPGAIGLALVPAEQLDPRTQAQLGVSGQQPAIAAAYYAAPSLTPGVVYGVSLIGLLEGRRLGYWVKLLTLKALRAHKQRGIAQWTNLSLRVHTRFGPMRILGPVPGEHDLKDQSFVYEVDVTDDAKLRAAALRQPVLPTNLWVAGSDVAQTQLLCQRAARGEDLYLVGPGLEHETLFLHDASLPHDVPRQ